MKRLYVLSTIFILSSLNLTHSMVRVKALGSSPRGQYVAVEEYGYKAGRKYPFSKIRVMNVWKNQYVDDAIHLIGVEDNESLGHIRNKAKRLASKKLSKFNISM